MTGANRASLPQAETVPSSLILHKLFMKVWATVRVPSKWKEGITVSLYKGKSKKNECSSCRSDITALRARRSLHTHLASLHQSDSGVTAGRSTMGAIVALRLLSKIHREFNQSLHVAYMVT